MAPDAPILIVGAGFSGAVYARELAEAGHRVIVIDRRSHVAGNAYDRVGAENVRVHCYGPHLFHTANTSVLAWITRFGTWVPYRHRVRALLPTGELAPLPINLDTINLVFGKNLLGTDEALEFLSTISERIEDPRNAAEYLASTVGIKLRDLFFRPYTRKMWATDLEDMSATVVKRLPLRFDREDTYFPIHEHQVMPERGYTHIIEQILDHDLIDVRLKVSFDKRSLGDFAFCFTSMSIDDYFEYNEGYLPYRSLKFHNEVYDRDALPMRWLIAEHGEHTVLNFTDNSRFTRETAWHRLPNHIIGSDFRPILTREEPCDFRDNNMERYYPVKTVDGSGDRLYQIYKMQAEAETSRIEFIGRCGRYQYLDMDQVINQSLAGVRRWLRAV